MHRTVTCDFNFSPLSESLWQGGLTSLAYWHQERRELRAGLLQRYCQPKLDRMFCLGAQPDSGGKFQTRTCFPILLMCKALVQVAAEGGRQGQTTHGFTPSQELSARQQ